VMDVAVCSREDGVARDLVAGRRRWCVAVMVVQIPATRLCGGGALVVTGKLAVVVAWFRWCVELVRGYAGAGTVAGAAVEMVRRRSASLLLWLLVQRGAAEVGGGG